MISIHAPACVPCGACAMVCPHQVIDMVDGKAVLARVEHCIECGACQVNCHTDAITVTKGSGCMLAIVRDDILGLAPADSC